MTSLTLGQRMKLYEGAYNSYITPRVPIIGRIDGRAFHTLTRNCIKPFDDAFTNTMNATASFLHLQAQGCMITYTQSDEISFVLRSDQSIESQPWFANRIQKIVSVATSAAAAFFNRHWNLDGPLAMFDCRIFVVPNLIEVQNYLIWRQRDCIKNSISSAAYFEIANSEEDGKRIGRKGSFKLLHKQNQENRKQLLLDKAGIEWETKYPDHIKYGHVTYSHDVEINGARRTRLVSEAAPVFVDNKEWLFNILNPPKENEDGGKEEQKEEDRQS